MASPCSGTCSTHSRENARGRGVRLHRCSPSSMPGQHVFSTRLGHLHGHAYLEVLVDGRPWIEVFGWDEHFEFGCRKARLIVGAQPLIRRFVRSQGMDPPFGQAIQVTTEGASITCVTYPRFRIRGLWIDLPYMELWHGTTSIGLGLTKADALLGLNVQVREFVAIHCWRVQSGLPQPAAAGRSRLTAEPPHDRNASQSSTGLPLLEAHAIVVSRARGVLPEVVGKTG